MEECIRVKTLQSLLQKCSFCANNSTAWMTCQLRLKPWHAAYLGEGEPMWCSGETGHLILSPAYFGNSGGYRQLYQNDELYFCFLLVGSRSMFACCSKQNPIPFMFGNHQGESVICPCVWPGSLCSPFAIRLSDQLCIFPVLEAWHNHGWLVKL